MTAELISPSVSFSTSHFKLVVFNMDIETIYHCSYFESYSCHYFRQLYSSVCKILTLCPFYHHRSSTNLLPSHRVTMEFLTWNINCDWSAVTTYNWHEQLKKGGEIGTIFFNLWKAFNSIPHKVLLEKIDQIGLCNPYSLGYLNISRVESRKLWLMVRSLST